MFHSWFPALQISLALAHGIKSTKLETETSGRDSVVTQWSFVSLVSHPIALVVAWWRPGRLPSEEPRLETARQRSLAIVTSSYLRRSSTGRSP